MSCRRTDALYTLPAHSRHRSYDARIEVEKALEAKGLLRGKENNKMRLGICSRSGDIIEPYLTPQWCVVCSVHMVHSWCDVSLRWRVWYDRLSCQTHPHLNMQIQVRELRGHGEAGGGGGALRGAQDPAGLPRGYLVPLARQHPVSESVNAKESWCDDVVALNNDTLPELMGGMVGYRDWCISRQLWWGHRIPAYFAQKKGETLDHNDQVGKWVGGCGSGTRQSSQDVCVIGLVSSVNSSSYT